MDTRLILEAIGTQLNCNSQVDGSMFDVRSIFDKAWYNFANLAIQLFHNSAGAVLINTVSAVDPSILLPVTGGPLPTSRQQDVRYVRVSCTVDFSRLISIPGPTVLRVGFYIELPHTMRVMVNGVGANYNLTSWLGAEQDVRYVRVSCTVDFSRLISIPGPTVLCVRFYIKLPQMMLVMVNGVGANYNLTSWLGADDLRGLTRDEVRLQILEPCLRDGPITLGVADFNLAEANVDVETIRDTIQAKILKLGFKQICSSIFQQLCPWVQRSAPRSFGTHPPFGARPRWPDGNCISHRVFPAHDECRKAFCDRVDLRHQPM